MVAPRHKKAPPSRFQRSTLAAYSTAILIGGGALTLFQWAQTDTDDVINSPRPPTLPVPPPTATAAASPDEDAYSLAKEQSFGYFTDITNENWRIAQTHHARLFPNYYANLNKFSNGPNDKGRVERLQKSNNHYWYGQNFQVEFIEIKGDVSILKIYVPVMYL